jgi:hypothetical protein
MMKFRNYYAVLAKQRLTCDGDQKPCWDQLNTLQKFLPPGAQSLTLIQAVFATFGVHDYEHGELHLQEWGSIPNNAKKALSCLQVPDDFVGVRLDDLIEQVEFPENNPTRRRR